VLRVLLLPGGDSDKLPVKRKDIFDMRVLCAHVPEWLPSSAANTSSSSSLSPFSADACYEWTDASSPGVYACPRTVRVMVTAVAGLLPSSSSSSGSAGGGKHLQEYTAAAVRQRHAEGGAVLELEVVAVEREELGGVHNCKLVVEAAEECSLMSRVVLETHSACGHRRTVAAGVVLSS